ncbi:hypothetical protein FRC12_020036 [Ceratobasidium sp. 428]|nr:hypothetical protein FRC12_020036 [Ceratobasidium sp. 428]
MQSATSPPPFVPYPNKHDSLPDYASQSQAELPVEKTPVEEVNTRGLPGLPVWSSIWPSGWTGQNQTLRARDEDSDDDSDESFVSGKEKGQLDDVPTTGELSVLPTPFPIPPRLYRSPHSDDEEDIDALELEITRLIEDTKQTKTDKKNFSPPFGLSRSGTQRSNVILGYQSQAPSRVPSLGRSARSGLGSSTAPPARAGEVELSPGGGSTLSSLLGRLAAPFSHTDRSRRMDFGHITPDEEVARTDETGALATPPDHVPPFKISTQPTSPFLTPPMAPPSTAVSPEAHPLTAPTASFLEPHGVKRPRLTSIPTQPSSRIDGPGHARSVSGSSTTTIRPLPVLPGSGL